MKIQVAKERGFVNRMRKKLNGICSIGIMCEVRVNRLLITSSDMARLLDMVIDRSNPSRINEKFPK